MEPVSTCMSRRIISTSIHTSSTEGSPRFRVELAQGAPKHPCRPVLGWEILRPIPADADAGRAGRHRRSKRRRRPKIHKSRIMALLLIAHEALNFLVRYFSVLVCIDLVEDPLVNCGDLFERKRTITVVIGNSKHDLQNMAMRYAFASALPSCRVVAPHHRPRHHLGISRSHILFHSRGFLGKGRHWPTG